MLTSKGKDMSNQTNKFTTKSTPVRVPLDTYRLVQRCQLLEGASREDGIPTIPEVIRSAVSLYERHLLEQGDAVAV